MATRLLEFIEVIFADDYNCWRGYSAAKSNDEILAQCRLCQASLHRWGEANSVKFDPAKESFHVLHRTRGSGGGFRLLGLLFDESVCMGAAMSEVGREAGWRLQAVRWPRGFFFSAGNGQLI